MKIISLFVMLASPAVALSQEWRGIVLLQSTCEDVKRALGVDKCDQSRSTYKLQGGTVTISFSQFSCPTDCPPYIIWNVPLGTVTGITWTPATPPPITDFNVDNGKWEKTFTDFLNQVIYGNSEEGLLMSVVNNRVESIIYYPAAKSNHLRCSQCPQPQPDADMKDIKVASKFDEYSNIPFESEKKRLDSFVEQLSHYPSTQAYIMVYGGRRAHAGEAETRAKRAKEYLVKVRGIDTRRIVTVNGGHREKLTVELYLVPLEATPPLSKPTVDPSDVQIIKAGSAKNNNRHSSRSRCN